MTIELPPMKGQQNKLDGDSHPSNMKQLTTRKVEVKQAASNIHLLNYALRNEDGTLNFPFAKHKRWMHWAQNMVERHRHIEQSRVCVETDYFKNMTNEQLEEIVKGNGQELRNMMQKMYTYAANVNGSPSYLYKERKRLEHLMSTKGMCSLWFTLTAADNHWNDLHRLLRNGRDEPQGNEVEKAKVRRRLVRQNPHIVDE